MSQDWSLTPAAAAPPQVKGKGMIWTGVALLVVGVVLIVAGIIGVIAATASLISGFGSPVTTPTTVTRTLEKGTTYAVYELSGLASGTGTTEDPLLATVSPADITVTGPGGVVVGVKDPGAMTQTFTNGGKEYFAVATFDAPATGSYEISIATEGAEVLIAPSFSAFGKSFAWIAAIGLGGLLALIGLILLIVGLVRRSSSKKAVAPAAGPTARPPTSSPWRSRRRTSSRCPRSRPCPSRWPRRSRTARSYRWPPSPSLRSRWHRRWLRSPSPR